MKKRAPLAYRRSNIQKNIITHGPNADAGKHDGTLNVLSLSSTWVSLAKTCSTCQRSQGSIFSLHRGDKGVCKHGGHLLKTVHSRFCWKHMNPCCKQHPYRIDLTLKHDSPTSDISGTVATNGPSGNLGALSLMSCTLMMNSDFGSRASSVYRSRACACRT